MEYGEKPSSASYDEYFNANDPNSAALAEGFRDILSDDLYEEVRRKPLREAKSLILSQLLETHNEHDDWDPFQLVERGYYRDR